MKKTTWTRAIQWFYIKELLDLTRHNCIHMNEYSTIISNGEFGSDLLYKVAGIPVW